MPQAHRVRYFATGRRDPGWSPRSNARWRRFTRSFR
jgi:hypothetical protein